MVIGTVQPAMWEGLCRSFSREDWLEEPRYATSALRGQIPDEINSNVAKIMVERTTQEWSVLFQKNDVLFAPVRTYAEMRDDEQMRHMGYFAETDQAPYGKLPLPHYPGTERTGKMPAAPHMGEHSREILAELGYGAEDIAGMERDKLVIQAA